MVEDRVFSRARLTAANGNNDLVDVVAGRRRPGAKSAISLSLGREDEATAVEIGSSGILQVDRPVRLADHRV